MPVRRNFPAAGGGKLDRFEHRRDLYVANERIGRSVDAYRFAQSIQPPGINYKVFLRPGKPPIAFAKPGDLWAVISRVIVLRLPNSVAGKYRPEIIRAGKEGASF